MAGLAADDRQETLVDLLVSAVAARMFAAGPAGFEGGMTARKYMGITGCSKASATRDLAALIQMGALTCLPGGGRSTRYALARLAP